MSSERACAPCSKAVRRASKWWVRRRPPTRVWSALALTPDLIRAISLPGRPAPDLIRAVRSALPKTRGGAERDAEERWVRETVAAGASGYLLKQLTRRDLVVEAIEGALSGSLILHPEARRLLPAERPGRR